MNPSLAEKYYSRLGKVCEKKTNYIQIHKKPVKTIKNCKSDGSIFDNFQYNFYGNDKKEEVKKISKVNKILFLFDSNKVYLMMFI